MFVLRRLWCYLLLPVVFFCAVLKSLSNKNRCYLCGIQSSNDLEPHFQFVVFFARETSGGKN